MTRLDRSIYVMGDVHGQLTKLIHVLHHAHLINPDGMWTGQPLWAGGQATLWFLGDFVDRGPAGLAVVELVMRLQREATEAGGAVHAILGNHEIYLLAAHHFADMPTGDKSTFRNMWLQNGGLIADLTGLRQAHIGWISSLPAMAQVDGHLLVHADALFYRDYGKTVASVNAEITHILSGSEASAWDQLLVRFAQRMAFHESRLNGPTNAVAFLDQYGGRRLVHGHTPIAVMTQQREATITGPHFYADGRCANCDGGMYLGGPGFVHLLGGPENSS
jgi:hypothetical protein